MMSAVSACGITGCPTILASQSTGVSTASREESCRLERTIGGLECLHVFRSGAEQPGKDFFQGGLAVLKALVWADLLYLGLS